MKTATLLVITLCATATAYADFSYRTTRKAEAAGGAPAVTKYFFKGHKMMTDSGTTASILDFETQTITNLNKTQQTYSVMKFGDIGQMTKQADMDVKIDVKETGQTKVINGFKASEVVMTMEMDSAQMGQAGMKMQMEMDIWRSSDVPGAGELKDFYQRNGDIFRWLATGAGGAAGMQKAMADMQRKLAAIGGVPVLQTIKAKAAGGPQADQMQARMAQARAQMEAMIKQGGPGAAAAQQALTRMNAMSGGGGSLFETTIESSDFSGGGIPDSTFAIPTGYKQTERK